MKGSDQKPLRVDEASGSSYEEWIFIEANKGGFHIKNRANNKVIDIPRSKTENGIPVSNFPTFHKGDNQRFYLK